MQYIRQHINEPLNREMLAAVAGFSVPHFHRIFTAHVGESAASYVRRLRLKRASFSKAFKQQFHLSPSEFRQLGCRAATQILMKG